MSEIVVEQKEKLVSDLKTVIADAQELLSLAADQVSESSAEVRGRIQTGLHLSRAKLAHLQEVAVTKAKSAGRATDAYVHENPWQSIGFAVGAGLIIGMLLRRR